MQKFSTKANCLCFRSNVFVEQDETQAMGPLQIVHSSKVLLHALTVNVHLLLNHVIVFSRQPQSNRALAPGQWDTTLMQLVAGPSTTAQERRSATIKKWGAVAPTDGTRCARHIKFVARTQIAGGSTSNANHVLVARDRRQVFGE